MRAAPTTDEVFARHQVAVAYLFGSRVEGTADEDSDHDVAVLSSGSPAPDATVRLGMDLDGTERELHGLVAERGRLFCSADEPRRVRFEVDARNRWIGFRPVVEQLTATFLRRVASEGLR